MTAPRDRVGIQVPTNLGPHGPTPQGHTANQIHDAPSQCEWCGADAVTRVVGTAACESCAAGGRAVRVREALQRWRRRAK